MAWYNVEDLLLHFLGAEKNVSPVISWAFSLRNGICAHTAMGRPVQQPLYQFPGSALLQKSAFHSLLVTLMADVDFTLTVSFIDEHKCHINKNIGVVRGH